MPPRQPLPREIAARAFTSSEARDIGVGEGRLRGPDLTRPFHGVRMPRAVGSDLEQLCRAKLLTMREGQVFSHVTAARLHGMVVPRGVVDDLVDVAAFRPAALPRGRGVRGHRLSEGGVRVGILRGLPVVAPEAAWAQLAASVGTTDLIIAADSLLQRGHSCSTLAVLRASASVRGRRGRSRLMLAIASVRAGTDSPEETRLRLDAVAYGLPEPDVNLPIHDASGRLVAIGDLVYPRYRTLLEYDGEHHRTDDRQFGRDVDRLDDLAALGWRVFRFTKRHRGAARADRLERVREHMVSMGWRPAMA